MLQSVADDKIFHLHNNVIAANLIENLLRYLYMRGFVFDDHARLEGLGVEHCVATARHAVEGELHLVRHKGGRIAFVIDKVVDESLTDPLFRRKCHKLVAQRVMDLQTPFCVFGLGCELWQIECVHVKIGVCIFYIRLRECS